MTACGTKDFTPLQRWPLNLEWRERLSESGMRMDFSKATNTMTEENDSMNCHHKTSDRRSNKANREDYPNGGNTAHSHLMQPMRCTTDHNRLGAEPSEAF